MPTVTTTRASRIPRSRPNRQTGPCTSGEITANASNGTALSRPSKVWLSEALRPTWDSTGPTDVIAGRMQAATRGLEG